MEEEVGAQEQAGGAATTTTTTSCSGGVSSSSSSSSSQVELAVAASSQLAAMTPDELVDLLLQGMRRHSDRPLRAAVRLPNGYEVSVTEVTAAAAAAAVDERKDCMKD